MSVYSCISIYFYILHIHVCIHTASWFVQILSLILPYKYRHISEYCSYWIWQDIYISVPIVIVRISAVLHQALIQPPVWSIFQLRFGCSFPGVQYTMTTETLVSKEQKNQADLKTGPAGVTLGLLLDLTTVIHLDTTRCLRQPYTPVCGVGGWI